MPWGNKKIYSKALKVINQAQYLLANFMSLTDESPLKVISFSKKISGTPPGDVAPL